MVRNAPAGFTGAYRDCATFANPLGNGYRWYLPWLMRFNAPDSLSPFGAGGSNAYAYCAADPINRSDPSGHMFNGLASDIGKVTDEDAASLAARASESAAQEASGTAPSSSGTANAPSAGGPLPARARRPRPASLVLPYSLRHGAPDLDALSRSLTRYRRAADALERGANALRQQWPALMRESRMERAALGLPDPIVAQEARLAVHQVALEADDLLTKLSQVEMQLAGRAGEFEKERIEIRGLQERVGAIHREAWDLYPTLRDEVDATGESVFRFGGSSNAN